MVEIIRDESPMGMFETMILAVEWGIPHCNHVNCTKQVAAIITGIEGTPTFGLCEEHFQQGNVPGGTTLELDFSRNKK